MQTKNPLPPKHVLVVDDERSILLTLEALLTRHGYTVHTARTAAQALETAAQHKQTAPLHLALVDIGLPDASGLEVLTQLHTQWPSLQTIVITAQDSLANAIESIKLGAFHFVSKPYAPEELLSLMQRALQQQELKLETETLRKETLELKARLKQVESSDGPVFKHRRMLEIQEMIQRVAPSEANVLITGESGVGKEVVANLIHTRSKRAAGPLIKLNCAALPAQMIEGELFGYVKGAFTGALHDFPGLIAAANHGTLFLDEIAEMPVTLQTRFLRVLQEREYRPLGSTKTLHSNFRLIAATNKNTAAALKEGQLRSDLYYRVNTFQFEIPPLRERREDIASLVALFLKRFAQQADRGVPKISAKALNLLLDYEWPGNVRELQNAVEYAFVIAQNDEITESQLPHEISGASENTSLTENENSVEDAPFVPSSKVAIESLKLEHMERLTIIKALEQTHGNKLKAAKILGIQRPTLYNKLKRLRIPVNER